MPTSQSLDEIEIVNEIKSFYKNTPKKNKVKEHLAVLIEKPQECLEILDSIIANSSSRLIENKSYKATKALVEALGRVRAQNLLLGIEKLRISECSEESRTKINNIELPSATRFRLAIEGNYREIIENAEKKDEITNQDAGSLAISEKLVKNCNEAIDVIVAETRGNTTSLLGCFSTAIATRRPEATTNPNRNTGTVATSKPSKNPKIK